MRSSSSVGANYRAACRAKSKAEFHAKLSIVVEEADESLFWMEISEEADIVSRQKLDSVMKEATEILKVVASARKKVSPVKK